MSRKCSVRPSRPAAFPFPAGAGIARKERLCPGSQSRRGPSPGAWTPTPTCTWPRRWIRWAGCWAPRPSRPMRPGTRLRWPGCSAHGELAKVGVEGTGSYGAGLARYLAACGVEVAEVIRPNRQARRRRGKSDAADAVAAALAALSGEASGVPKSRDGAVESIRALRVARAGAVKARTQAGNQLRDLILTAPEQLRQQLAGLPRGRQVDLAARFRPRRPGRPCRGRQGGDGQRGPPPPGAGRRDRPARCRARGTRHARRPGKVPGQAGRGHPGRRHAAGHRRRQPRPGPHARPASPRCAAPARSMPPPASRSATGSTAAATGRPTPRSGRSP